MYIFRRSRGWNYGIIGLTFSFSNRLRFNFRARRKTKIQQHLEATNCVQPYVFGKNYEASLRGEVCIYLSLNIEDNLPELWVTIPTGKHGNTNTGLALVATLSLAAFFEGPVAS